MSATRYTCIWLVSVVAFLAGTAAFNALVDPYLLFDMRRIDGFNARKPTTPSHSAMVKAYQVERVAPRAVIVGASRVDIGLDPDHLAWPHGARPVYNYGVPGAALQDTLRQLRHAAEAGHLRLAVVGLDFENFLEREALEDPVGDERARRVAVGGTGPQGLQRSRQRMLDMLRATLTLGATLDSIQTLAAQTQAVGPDISDHGATSEGAFALIVRADGYHDLFAQKEAQVVGRYTSAAKALDGVPAGEDANLVYVRSIIEFCRDQGIDLYLFVQPLHATLLSMINSAGLWNRFEEWKVSLVELVDESRAESSRTKLVLWDFAEYSEFTTEIRPQKGDRSTELKWFWEPGHYKKALGNVMLSRMLTTSEVNFGMSLSGNTIKERLLQIRAGRQEYANAHSREVARIADLVIMGR